MPNNHNAAINIIRSGSDFVVYDDHQITDFSNIAFEMILENSIMTARLFDKSDSTVIKSIAYTVTDFYFNRLTVDPPCV